MKALIPSEPDQKDFCFSLIVDNEYWCASFIFDSVTSELFKKDGIVYCNLINRETGFSQEHELSSADIDWKDDGFILYCLGQAFLDLTGNSKDDLMFNQLVEWMKEV